MGGSWSTGLHCHLAAAANWGGGVARDHGATRVVTWPVAVRRLRGLARRWFICARHPLEWNPVRGVRVQRGAAHAQWLARRSPDLGERARVDWLELPGSAGRAPRKPAIHLWRVANAGRVLAARPRHLDAQGGHAFDVVGLREHVQGLDF